jgi:hypothetical protein
VRVNGASTSFGLSPSAINGLYNHILSNHKNWPSLNTKQQVTYFLPNAKNVGQQTINNVSSFFLDNPIAMQRYKPILYVQAASPCNNAR